MTTTIRSETHTRKRVCIVGAGIAGLVTAKVFAEDGFDVVVFEKEDHFGGTWAPARSYPGLRTNNSKYTYAFSDFPYPDETDAFPHGTDVTAYLESYVDRFDIRDCIRLKSCVGCVRRTDDPENRFLVTLAGSSGDGSEQTLTFDFVVVCNGVYHEPHMPAFDGVPNFLGTIMPSCDVTADMYRASKHAVVIGGGKSALDGATAAAKFGVSPVLVMRKPIWVAPRFVAGTIPSDFLLLNRIVSRLLPYHHLHGVERFLHGFGKPIATAWWRSISYIFRRVNRIPLDLTPKPLPQGIERIGVGGEFYKELNAGRVSARVAEIRRFGRDHIELETGEQIAADLVICATGWEQNLNFLSPEIRAEVLCDARFQLYRHILPPRIREMGFIGYASSVAAQLTAEVGAHWLSQHFLGAIDLPTEAEMDAAIERVHRWAAAEMSTRKAGFFIGAHVPQYIDDLLQDMGLPQRRRPDFVRENFAPLMPTRYATLGEERRQHRAGHDDGGPFYFSAWHALALVLGILAVAVL